MKVGWVILVNVVILEAVVVSKIEAVIDVAGAVVVVAVIVAAVILVFFCQYCCLKSRLWFVKIYALIFIILVTVASIKPCFYVSFPKG